MINIMYYHFQEGQYMRTLKPRDVDVNYAVDMLTLSYQGHVIYTGIHILTWPRDVDVNSVVDMLTPSYQGHVIYTSIY